MASPQQATHYAPQPHLDFHPIGPTHFMNMYFIKLQPHPRQELIWNCWWSGPSGSGCHRAPTQPSGNHTHLAHHDLEVIGWTPNTPSGNTAHRATRLAVIGPSGSSGSWGHRTHGATAFEHKHRRRHNPPPTALSPQAATNSPQFIVHSQLPTANSPQRQPKPQEQFATRMVCKMRERTQWNNLFRYCFQTNFWVANTLILIFSQSLQFASRNHTDECRNIATPIP